MPDIDDVETKVAEVNKLWSELRKIADSLFKDGIGLVVTDRGIQQVQSSHGRDL